MASYYNEIDGAKAEWLRENIKANLIAPGEVDERSICDVQPEDLRGFTQCHFFAGVGIWSYALRLAGWPDSRPVWTGSCPCQPFSVSGKREGGADDRHLWPHWARLIRECRPSEILGEQVEAAVRHGWFDLVSDDLEAAGYAVGAVAFPACSVGAPHIRQRLYFGAYALRQRSDGERVLLLERESRQDRAETSGCGATERSADTERDGGRSDFPLGKAQGRAADGRDCATGQHSDITGERRREAREPIGGCLQRDGEPGEPGDTTKCGSGPLDGKSEAGDGQEIAAGRSSLSLDCGNTSSTGLERQWRLIELGGAEGREAAKRYGAASGATRGFWANCDWWYGRDGKFRPIKPGLQPLAHGASARVLRLRGYGDAIVAPQAKEFIEAFAAILPQAGGGIDKGKRGLYGGSEHGR